MAGIMNKIGDALHIGGDKKDGDQHKGESHGIGGEHKGDQHYGTTGGDQHYGGGDQHKGEHYGTTGGEHYGGEHKGDQHYGTTGGQHYGGEQQHGFTGVGHHGAEQQQHRPEEKEGFMEKIQDKIHGDKNEAGGQYVDGEKKKKKDKKKREGHEHGHGGGHDSSSSDSRLTLTNYSLYFEASGVIKYEDAIKIDLSKDVERSVKPVATGPWGAQIYDKAIVYNSTDLSEGTVLEFPELTSSTRRDHWLALIREIIFIHQFLSKYKIKFPIQTWEMHARTMLAIVRLHAAREMLRMSPPVPTKFLIFSLYNEIPKGDYVLEELADSLKRINGEQPCSASSILRSMNIVGPVVSDSMVEDASQAEESVSVLDDTPSLESAIKESREEEKKVLFAKATTEELKEEGVTDSVLVLTELLKPLKNVVPWLQEIFTWERPIITIAVLAALLMITYMEWVGKAAAAFLVWVILKMLEAREKKLNEKCNEIVISRSSMSSDQSTMDSIVSAQHGLYTVHEMMQIANIAMLKMWSILISKADKHANAVMVAMGGLAVLLAVIPFKFFLMALIVQSFTMTLKRSQSSGSGTGNRRLKEWWDSIPIVPIRVVDDARNTGNTKYNSF